MSLVGLEIGGRVGANFEHRSEVIGGAVLIAVGTHLLLGSSDEVPCPPDHAG